MTGFTGFSGETEKQSGNYLALSFEADEDAKVTVTFGNAQTTTSPILLEPGDRDCVFRISNKDTQTISVKVEKNGVVIEKMYSLSGLMLEPQSPVE